MNPVKSWVWIITSGDVHGKLGVRAVSTGWVKIENPDTQVLLPENGDFICNNEMVALVENMMKGDT